VLNCAVLIFALILDLQNGAEPIDTQIYVDTYPDFHLRSLSETLAFCSHTEGAFIDYWDGRWVTSKLDIAITVNKAYPILIRLRPSLHALTDCPGLDEQLKRQPRVSTKSKRTSDTLVSPLKKAPRLGDQSVASESREKGKGKEVAKSSSPSPTYSPFVHGTFRKPAPFPLDLDPVAVTSVSSSSHKAWPRDFYVCEVVKGLKHLGEKMDSEKLSQRSTFLVIFPAVKYNKTQMANTRLILDRAGSILRNRFVEYGKAPKGTWKAFRAQLPKTILDKSFAGHQAIRELEDASSTSDDSGDELRNVDHGPTDKPAVPLHLDDNLDTSDSDDSHTHTGDRCEFCDERLDFEPSPTLRDMRTALQERSQPDPMPGHPNHRKVKSFTVTIEYCQRHRVEAKVFPTAHRQGWPFDIDFSRLYDRVLLLHPHIEILLEYDNVKKSVFYQDVMATFAPGTSTAAASGAAGQWASFKGHGAG
jgi:hypothetical protein